ncbi:MAG TPA: hypothetical protein VGK00_12625 [Anaerolineales bacterium]
MLLVLAVLTALVYWANLHLRPLLKAFSTRQSVAFMIYSFFFAGLLVVMVPIPLDKFFYTFSPTHRLTISAKNGRIKDLKILQFKSASGDLNPAEILTTPEGDLVWQGKVGNQAVLAFQPSSQPLRIKVDWDGSSQPIELSSTSKRDAIFVKQTFPIPGLQHGAWLLSVWLALASLVFAISLLLLHAPWKPARSRIPWLWFALPMVLVWTIYLLTYWPGLMSPDSVMQWGEVQSSQFSDAHPAVHTMFIWLFSRLWNTPAVLVIFHILLLSLLFAWGLGELQKHSVSPIVLVAGAAILALFPLNGFLVITVWKDITYACAIFALFLQFIKIVLSDGDWLKNNWNLAGLILAGLTAAFVRHNGLPVVLGSLLVLLLAYRRSLWRLLACMVIFLFIWVAIRGPLYSSLNVKQYPGFGNILFLDHINAHIHAGTALLPDETNYIESLLPISSWPYNCADSDIRKMDGPIPFDYFTQTTGEPARIALNLFLRDPGVDIEHTLCSSSLVWKINTGHYLYILPLAQNKNGAYTWVSENELGLSERSFLPRLVPILPDQLSDKGLFTKPAFYLLAALFIIAILSFRQPRKKIFLIAIPLIFQTGVMALVNFAQDFRYLYSTVLIALFCLIMLFLPVGTDTDQPFSRHRSANPHVSAK